MSHLAHGAGSSSTSAVSAPTSVSPFSITCSPCEEEVARVRQEVSGCSGHVGDGGGGSVLAPVELGPAAGAAAAAAGPADQVEGEDEGDDIVQAVEEGGEESRVPQKVWDPAAPSRAEWLAHQATHLPFRSWCRFCVEGRASNQPHHRAGKEDEQLVPEIHLDYAFARRETEEDTITMLVAKHRQSRAVRAWVVPRKGPVEEVAAELALEGVRGFGVTGTSPCILKCDNEASIKALRARVGAMLPGGGHPPGPCAP